MQWGLAVKTPPWRDDSLAPNGRPVSDNFAAWFKESRVVDAEGHPLLVYHGTNSAPGGDAIRSFDLGRTGSAMGNRYKTGAAFFTDSPGNASGYAHSRLNMRFGVDRVQDYGGNVLPVYLSFKSPLVVDAEGRSFKAVVATALRRAAAAAKYDSVVIRNVIDAHVEGPDEALSTPATTYIAIDPRQVKSGIGNSGLYDIESHYFCDRLEARVEQVFRRAQLARQVLHESCVARSVVSP